MRSSISSKETTYSERLHIADRFSVGLVLPTGFEQSGGWTAHPPVKKIVASESTKFPGGTPVCFLPHLLFFEEEILNSGEILEGTHMQFSTNLPYGEKQIREHIESGANLPMNVSREADQAFMAELRRTDPKRYARLEKAIQTDLIRLPKAA